MKRYEVFLLIYTLLTYALNTSLFMLSESRVDAYISVNILVFYITYAVVKPIRNPGLPWKILQAALLCLFAIIVGYRVYEVLFK